jgi:hypothetical protein
MSEFESQQKSATSASTAETAVALMAPAPTAEAAAAPDWQSALPDDLRPLAQAKGWKSPAEAVKSYAHLERLIGAERIALPAKDGQGRRDWSKWEGWAALGRPEAPERYAFKGQAGRELSESDRDFHRHMAPHLHRAGLAQWQVDLLAEGLEGFGAQHRERGQRRVQEELAAAEAELRRDWDRDYERHLDLANRAVRRFGGPELARALGRRASAATRRWCAPSRASVPPWPRMAACPRKRAPAASPPAPARRATPAPRSSVSRPTASSSRPSSTACIPATRRQWPACCACRRRSPAERRNERSG